MKYMPYVLTEQGVMMLSGLLKSDIAAKVNVKIIQAFVNMRKYISTSLLEQQHYKDMLLEHDSRITQVEEVLFKLNDKKQTSTIFFEGQIYDAYSLLVDILKEAKEEILIIDNYIDKTILDIVSLLEVKTILITNKYNKLDIQKYQEQYSNITIQIDNSFHDRFIILDKEKLYHSGASFKDIGKKCFALTKIENKEVLEYLLKQMKKTKIHL